jgi:hypothetical protein
MRYLLDFPLRSTMASFSRVTHINRSEQKVLGLTVGGRVAVMIDGSCLPYLRCAPVLMLPSNTL